MAKVLRKTKTKKALSRVAMRKVKVKFAKPARPKIGFVQVGQTKLRHGISKAETVWLDRLGVPERSKVIRGFNNKIMIVDGYDAKSKTIWEFLRRYVAWFA